MKYQFDKEFTDVLPSLPATNFEDPIKARALMAPLVPVGAEKIDEAYVSIEDRTILRPEDQSLLAIRIYRPRQLESRAVILNIHGGGFVVGDLDSDHTYLVKMSKDLNVMIVSVDYRLAPEHRYPKGLEDCYTALQWISNNAQELKVDKNLIAIMGQSGGGGLGAALALLVKERSGPPICFQYLGIPELDDRLETESMKAFTDTPMWDRKNAEYSWKHYLGDAYQTDQLPITAAPGRATVEDLNGLPAAYINTMLYDPLRDEAILYAMRLMQAGVSVELHNYPGAFHGATVLLDSKRSKQAYEDSLIALRRALDL